MASADQRERAVQEQSTAAQRVVEGLDKYTARIWRSAGERLAGTPSCRGICRSKKQNKKMGRERGAVWRQKASLRLRTSRKEKHVKQWVISDGCGSTRANGASVKRSRSRELERGAVWRQKSSLRLRASRREKHVKQWASRGHRGSTRANGASVKRSRSRGGG